MNWHKCEGLTSDEACIWLFDRASELPPNQFVVEVGVYRGKSLLALAEGSLSGNGALVYGVDPWNMARPSKEKYKSDETYEYVHNAAHASKARDLIWLIQDFGVSAAGRWAFGRNVGLLYIDADHRRVPVLEDVNSWSPHLVPGAWVCFDDCHPDFPGVAEAIVRLERLGRITDVAMVTDRLCASRFVQ